LERINTPTENSNLKNPDFILFLAGQSMAGSGILAAH
jgi:hypothetical protein